MPIFLSKKISLNLFFFICVNLQFLGKNFYFKLIVHIRVIFHTMSFGKLYKNSMKRSTDLFGKLINRSFTRYNPYSFTLVAQALRIQHSLLQFGYKIARKNTYKNTFKKYSRATESSMHLRYHKVHGFYVNGSSDQTFMLWLILQSIQGNIQHECLFTLHLIT